MPIDPDVRAYLDKLDALPIPSFDAVPVDQARALYRGMRLVAGRPEPVARVADRVVAGSIPTRIYWPDADDPAGPRPGLVYCHGGGWVLGDLDTVDHLCRKLANASGCVVASVAYRRPPEHKFPAPLDDCYQATQAIADLAGELGIDPDRLAVGGDSAGGNLAAGVAIRARDAGGPDLAAQVLLYPITDHAFDTGSYHEFAIGYGLDRTIMAWFWDQYLADPADGASPWASPLRVLDAASLPPALVVTAECDVLRDEAEAYARKLADAGVAVTPLRIAGLVHGFVQMTATFDAARTALGKVGSWLADQLDRPKGRH